MNVIENFNAPRKTIPKPAIKYQLRTQRQTCTTVQDAQRTVFSLHAAPLSKTARIQADVVERVSFHPSVRATQQECRRRWPIAVTSPRRVTHPFHKTDHKCGNIMFFIFFMHVSQIPAPYPAPKALPPNWMAAEGEMAKNRATFFATPCSRIAKHDRAFPMPLSDEAFYCDPLMRRNVRAFHAFRRPNHHRHSLRNPRLHHLPVPIALCSLP